MEKNKTQTYFEQQELFLGGAFEALDKVTHVATSKSTQSDDTMHDRGWSLTKAAKAEFTKVVNDWFDNNYKDLYKLIAHGGSWYALGIWFVCSVQGCGIGYYDAYLGISDEETRRKLKRLGNKLHKAAQSTFKTTEAFDLYHIRGKYCAFDHPLTT